MQFLFKSVDGRPVPVLIDEGDTRAADGVTLFSLAQAAANFGMSEASLSAVADAFFKDLIPSDAPLINPGAATATLASPTRAALLRRHLAPYLSPEQCEEFLRRCDLLDLDPWCKHVYPRLEHNDRTGLPEVLVLIAIGGLRTLAHRTGECAGIDEGVFTYGDDSRFPAKCTVTVYRFVQGQRVPFVGRALWDEFYPVDDPGLWDEKPERCLETCAEAHALRRAFGLEGTYAPEEFDRQRARTPARRRGADEVGHAEPALDAFGAGNVEELDLPASQMDFERRLAHLGVGSAERRAAILGMLKSRFAKMYMASHDRFFRHAFAYLMANPKNFGIAPPEEAAG